MVYFKTNHRPHDSTLKAGPVLESITRVGKSPFYVLSSMTPTVMGPFPFHGSNMNSDNSMPQWFLSHAMS